MTRRWQVALGANVLLGIPGVIPIWMLWFLAASWTSGPESTDNDPMVLWLPIATVIVVPYVMLWLSVNRSIARRSSLAPRTYWWLSALATFLPTTALIIYSP
jgi:TRAP-type mannitol/chloroaromatic compound transport system permease small subunit